MSSRSLNKVTLIGNLTRDPELRYTPSGTAVCTFGLATNRSWTTQTGETKEETEFHRIVSWNKLAELCSQLLLKGRKVYVEGRLSTRAWTGQDGQQRTTTEVVIEDMILLDYKKVVREGEEVYSKTNFSTNIPTTITSTPSGTASGVNPPAAADSQTQPTAQSSTDAAKKVSTHPADKADKKGKSEKTEVKKKDDITDLSDLEEITPEDIPF